MLQDLIPNDRSGDPLDDLRPVGHAHPVDFLLSIFDAPVPEPPADRQREVRVVDRAHKVRGGGDLRVVGQTVVPTRGSLAREATNVAAPASETAATTTAIALVMTSSSVYNGVHRHSSPEVQRRGL